MFAMAFCVREFSDWTEITVDLGCEHSFIDILTQQSFDHQTPCWAGWAQVGADLQQQMGTTRIISSSVVFSCQFRLFKNMRKSSNWIPWNTKDRVGHRTYLKLPPYLEPKCPHLLEDSPIKMGAESSPPK